VTLKSYKRVAAVSDNGLNGKFSGKHNRCADPNWDEAFSSMYTWLT